MLLQIQIRKITKHSFLLLLLVLCSINLHGKIITNKLSYCSTSIGSINHSVSNKLEFTDSTSNDTAPKYTKVMSEHFLSFLEGLNPYSYANHNSRIFFVVTNIENDNDFTYIKMYIINKSSSKYSISDIILMQVEDPLGRKSSLMLKSNYIQAIDTKLPIDKSVNAGGRELIGMAIPLYSGIDNGKLIIQVFEQNGSRNGKIEIKAKDITRAPMYIK